MFTLALIVALLQVSAPTQFVVIATDGPPSPQPANGGFPTCPGDPTDTPDNTTKVLCTCIQTGNPEWKFDGQVMVMTGRPAKVPVSCPW